MTVIIDSELPRYPANNSEELNSVFKLLDLLDKEFVKPDAKIMDKYPATDGLIQLVDKEQRVKGKFDIQIKTLPDNQLNKPGYQCEKSFLKYCEVSQLPVLLIAVNIAAEKAWWQYMSRDVLKQLALRLKKNSVALHFPESQVISRADHAYVGQWSAILDQEKNKLIELERLTARVAELEKRSELLSSFPKPIHTISDEDIQRLFIFLDTLNAALSGDFSTVKETFYREYRQLGLAYSIFEDKELEYAMYPIKYGQNDLNLREVHNLSAFADNQNILLTMTHYGDNPIKANAVGFAYKYIKDDTLEILKERYIKVLSNQLCVEYICDFLEYAERIFRFNRKIVNVQQLYERINNFTPLWCEEFLKLREMSLPFTYEFDLDHMLYRVMPAEKNKIYGRAQERYKAGEQSDMTVHFVSGEIDFALLFHAVNKMLQENIKTIARPYPTKNFAVKSGLVYDWFDQHAAFEKVKFVFEALPLVYDEFINAFFPNLAEVLGFYSGRDLVIVNLYHPGEGIKIGNEPHVEVSSFRAAVPFEGQKMKIFLNNEGSPMTERPHRYWEKGMDIDGMNFKIISSGGYPTLELFNRFTLQNYLYDDLLSNFKSYFEKLTDM